MNQLLGKVSKKILITGSSSNVGKALIEELSKKNQLFCIDKKIVKKNFVNVQFFKSSVINEKKLINIKKKN